MEDTTEGGNNRGTSIPTVPKFSSFRPPPNPPSTSAPEVARRARRERSKSKSPQGRKRRSKEKPRVKVERDLILEIADELTKADRVSAPKSTPMLGLNSRIFNAYLNTRGDPAIAQFGDIDRIKVPTYSLAGAGFVVGLSEAWRLAAKKEPPRVLQPAHAATQTKKVALASR
ncbi:hypothetical protein L0F63_002427 [Massospora cicadina]|nr:hypothetical protein L0F63_002427 [Massospora cicadina]